MTSKETITADTGLVNSLAVGFIFLTLLLSFRSLTLPFILIFVIESAIWINLSTPYFTGVPLVYMGYLVINTVQLGATIDYAILMTDGYIENRKTIGRREAVMQSLNENIISLFDERANSLACRAVPAICFVHGDCKRAWAAAVQGHAPVHGAGADSAPGAAYNV